MAGEREGERECEGALRARAKRERERLRAMAREGAGEAPRLLCPPPLAARVKCSLAGLQRQRLEAGGKRSHRHNLRRGDDMSQLLLGRSQRRRNHEHCLCVAHMFITISSKPAEKHHTSIALHTKTQPRTKTHKLRQSRKG